MRREIGLVVLIAAATADASAAPDAAPAPTFASPARCTVGEGAALSEIACELARAVPAPSRPLTVSVSGITSSKPLIRTNELATRLARVVAGALGPGAVPRLAVESLGVARAAGATPFVLSLAVEVIAGETRVTADLYGKAPGFWDRVRHGSHEQAAPLVHAFASRRLDGEMSTFIPTTPLVVTSVQRGTLGVADTVALACGDIDRDGSPEIAVIGRQKIQVGRLRNGRFDREKEAAWASLAPIAPAPLREPIGAAYVPARGGLRAGVTDRARGVELGANLELVSRLDDALPWPEVGCIGENGTALTAPGPCSHAETPRLDLSDVTDVDAVTGSRWLTPSGVPVVAAAFRSPRNGSVTLRDSLGKSIALPRAGAALALSDLDRDGAVELLTSLDTADPKADALVVSTWIGATMRERYRLPVPEGVRAVATCPADGEGAAPIVVASDRELWVIR